MVWLHDEPRPPEPISNRGLIVGQATLRLDGFQGKHEQYSRPLTVVIASKTDGSEDSSADTIEVPADPAGFFAVGNLSTEKHYWVKAVKGKNFTASIPFQASGPIRSEDSDSDKRTDVMDVGQFALSVDSDGSIGCELSSPTASLKKKPGDSSMQLLFESPCTLDRHRWFEQAYSRSGWTSKVRADRERIEREREKKKEGQGTGTAPPPKAAPLPAAPKAGPSA